MQTNVRASYGVCTTPACAARVRCLMLDIGPTGKGATNALTADVAFGLEQRATEKRRQLALQVDSLGKWDVQNLPPPPRWLQSEEVAKSARLDAAERAVHETEAVTTVADITSVNLAAATAAGAEGSAEATLAARLRQERRDLMLTLRDTNIASLQRDSSGVNTMHLIDLAIQVDETAKRSSPEKSSAKGDVPGRGSTPGQWKQFTEEGGFRAASTLVRTPTALLNGAALERRSSEGSVRRSTRGVLPKGIPPGAAAPPSGYPPGGHCGCCDPLRRGAASEVSSHRAEPRRSFSGSQRPAGTLPASAGPGVGPGSQLPSTRPGVGLGGGGGGGGGGDAARAAPALHVQAAAQTAGLVSPDAAVYYTHAGVLHHAAHGQGGGALKAATGAAAREDVLGIRREGVGPLADRRPTPMKGVQRTEQDYALCVAAAYALLGLRGRISGRYPTAAKPSPALFMSSGYSTRYPTQGAHAVKRKALPPGAPPDGVPPLPARIDAMLTGVPPQPGQPGLASIRKLNLSQGALQPRAASVKRVPQLRPANVERALSRARQQVGTLGRAVWPLYVATDSPATVPGACSAC